MDSNFIETNHIKLHVVTKGNPKNPAIVFLHGFPDAWFGWQRQMDFFASRGFFVIAPDQRGYNLSDKPTGVENYHITSTAKDIIGLLDFYDIDKAYLVGHDWGGAISWTLSLLYPERFHKVVAINVPHPYVMYHALKEDKVQRRKSHYIFFFRLPVIPEFLLPLGGWRALLQGFKKDPRPGTFTEDDLAKYREAWSQPGAIKSMLNWYRAIFAFPKPEFGDGKVQIPFLLVWGDNDKYLDVRFAEPSIKYCPQGQIKILEGASHWVPHEFPAETNQIISEFIDAD